MLGGPLSDFLAVAAEVLLYRLGFLGVADGDVHQPYWLFFGAAGGAGDAGYA